MEAATGIITSLRAVKNGAGRRINVYLDGKLAFSLDEEVVLKEKLKVGQVLGGPQLTKLRGLDSDMRCLNAAYQFLSPRPRSRSEIMERLKKRGFAEPEIDRTLTKLEHLHLVDDAAFAEYWKDNRTAFRPRSRQMLKQELHRKGLESSLISSAVDQMDDSAGAYRAASIRARRLPVADYSAFYKTLSGYLLRRGFSYTITKNTVKQIWLEKTGSAPARVENEEETGIA